MGLLSVLTEFWIAIQHHNRDDIVTTPTYETIPIIVDGIIVGRKLKFIDKKIEFGDTSLNGIYVRDCYEEEANALIDLMNNSPEDIVFAEVSGSSGIGKTVFIPYLILRLVQRDPRGTICFKSARVTGQIIYYFYIDEHAGPAVKVWTNDVDPDPDYFISDTNPELGVRAKHLFLHVSSHKNDNLIKLREMMQMNPENINRFSIFDPFTFEEYLYCCGMQVNNQWQDEHLFRLKYDIFGGCIRYLISKKMKFNQFDGEYYQQEIKNFFQNVYDANNRPIVLIDDETGVAVQNEYTETILTCASVLTYEMYLIEKKYGNPGQESTAQAHLATLFCHLFRNRERSDSMLYLPASLFMKYLWATLNKRRDSTLWGRIRGLFGASGTGIFFEQQGHDEAIRRLWSAEGLTVVEIAAEKSGRKKTVVTKNFKLTGKPMKKLVRDIQDVVNLPVGYYGIPVSSYFPVTDAIVRCNDKSSAEKSWILLLQFTIAGSHNTRVKTETRQLLYENCTVGFRTNTLCNLVYFTTDAQFQNFKFDPHLNDGLVPATAFRQFKVASNIVATAEETITSSSSLTKRKFSEAQFEAEEEDK